MPHERKRLKRQRQRKEIEFIAKPKMNKNKINKNNTEENAGNRAIAAAATHICMGHIYEYCLVVPIAIPLKLSRPTTTTTTATKKNAE